MRKILVIAGLATLAAGAYAQSNLATRVFTFDGSQATNGLSTFEVDNATVSNSGTSGTDTANAVTSATAAGASFAANTTIHVKTYVYMNGNFGGTFTIHGAGSNTDTERDEDIEVRANRPLTFTTSAFTTLKTGGASAAATGSINYGLSIYSDYPANTIVGSAVTGIDTAFNGQSVAFAMSDLPTDGKMTLHFARTLSVTQLSKGATDYTASGTIAVTVG